MYTAVSLLTRVNKGIKFNKRKRCLIMRRSTYTFHRYNEYTAIIPSTLPLPYQSQTTAQHRSVHNKAVVTTGTQPCNRFPAYCQRLCHSVVLPESCARGHNVKRPPHLRPQVVAANWHGAPHRAFSWRTGEHCDDSPQAL